MEKKRKRGKYGQYNSLNMGAPSTLTNEKLQEIRFLVLQGKNDPEIQEILNIPQTTWSTWRVKNHLDFSLLLNQWEQEYITRTSQQELKKLILDKDNRVKLDAIKYSLERLNKKDYSSRSETKSLPVDEKLEEEEKDRLNDLIKNNKKEITQEKVETYKEVSVSNS